MRIWYKVVSASLVLMALLAPLASLALCVPDSTSSMGSMQCPPDCPMMAGMQGQQDETALTEGAFPPCCTISSSKPAPVTESAIVAPSVAAEPLVAVAGISTPVSSTLPVEETDTSPPPINGSQALLCTFLI